MTIRGKVVGWLVTSDKKEWTTYIVYRTRSTAEAEARAYRSWHAERKAKGLQDDRPFRVAAVVLPSKPRTRRAR